MNSSQVTTILSVVLIFLLLLSFVVGGAKIAYFALDNKDLDVLKTKQQPAYRRIIELLDSSQAFYASLQVAQYFLYFAIIIIGSLIVNTFITPEMLDVRLIFAIKVFALFLVIMLVGEILSKLYAAQNPIRFAKDFGMISQAIYYVFGRIGRWLITFSFGIDRLLFKRGNTSLANDEELDLAIDNFAQKASSEEEKNILKGIVQFSTIRAKQIMRPRLDVVGMEFNSSFSSVIENINQLNYSRLPIYKGNLDNIVGLIYTKDILPYLHETADFDWHSLMRTPVFVHEQKLIEELLHEFQQTHTHFAVVVDEFGGTSGIVTIEDVQEEIIGDIKDEFDEDENKFKKLDEHTYIFDGKMMILDVCKAMDLPLDTFDNVRGSSESLAGLVLEVAKEIPAVNSAIKVGDFTFTVLEIERNRLEKIQISYQLKAK